MKIHSFQELVSRIVHLSTRDGKTLPITFSGTNAFTSTKSVNIPTLPSGTILTPNQFSIWLGYVIHEAGHQSYTDLNLYEKTCQNRKNSKFSYLLNLFEDIRIENKTISLYPGDRKYLDSVRIFVDNKIPNSLAQNPDILGLIYKHLFVSFRNINTNRISGTLKPELIELISEIKLCFSTQDCIILTDKVIDYLNNQNQNQNQNQNKDSQRSRPQEKDQSRGKNDKRSEISNGNSSNGSNCFRNNSNQSPRPNSGNQTNNQTDSNQFVTSWQEITEIKNLIKVLISSHIANQNDPTQNNSNSGKSIFPPTNILNDRIYVMSSENLKLYALTRNSCSSEILSLKKMFRIYLQAKTQKATLRGLESGKLDPHRLSHVATGSKLIFKDNSLKFLPETAIELIIDMSSSMNSHIARTSAIILAESLSSIPQIKLSISGFTTNNLSRVNYDPIPNSGRQHGMDIIQFKNFSEPYSKCKFKLGMITNSGYTPLGDAYGKALEHIILRPEPRRIIFLITDGQPEFTCGKNHSDFLLMKKVFASAQKFKIQTLGLGIGRNLNFLNSYFDETVNITNIQDLPKNLLEALKKFI